MAPVSVTRIRALARELWTIWRLRGADAAVVGQALYDGAVRLGPTFIKLGQIASTRPDLVDPEISAMLRRLQEQVPPVDFERVREVLEEDLGEALDVSFAEVETEPLASASLSQVHRARLPDGTPIVVKVQRQGIRHQIATDLRILRAFARIAGLAGTTLGGLRPEAVVDEFAAWTQRELDFEQEGRNLDRFRSNFEDWDDVTFPRVYWSHTTSRVLTMEPVDGLRLWDVRPQLGDEKAARFATRLTQVEMKMFVTDQFFHADLHPGNVFFGQDGTIAVLDVGMVGELDSRRQSRFLAYWIAITRRDRDRAFHHLLASADDLNGAAIDAFRHDYDRLLDDFYDATVRQRSLARTYLDIVVAGARHGVRFPPALVLQAKAVFTAESLALELAPNFRFADEVRPIVAEVLARRASAERIFDLLWSTLPDWILVGEWSPSAGAGRTPDAPEAAFRRSAGDTWVDNWADTAERRLVAAQARAHDMARPDWWRAHPELRLVLHAALATLDAAAATTSDVPGPSAPDPRDNDDETFDALRHSLRRSTDHSPQAARAITPAAAISALTALRLLVGRLPQLRKERQLESSRPGSGPGEDWLCSSPSTARGRRSTERPLESGRGER